MPAQSKKRAPMAVMAENLAYAKRQCLRHGRPVDEAAFEKAWTESWADMRSIRAWAHATDRRAEQRAQMLELKGAMLEAWLDMSGQQGSVQVFAGGIRESVDLDGSRAGDGAVYGEPVNSRGAKSPV